jgi:hypothetical protein
VSHRLASLQGNDGDGHVFQILTEEPVPPSQLNRGAAPQ